MGKFTLFLFVLLFPVILYAQDFKPLLDPTIACSYGSPNNPADGKTNRTMLVYYYFIVEEMPWPKVSFTQIEKLLNEKIHFSEDDINEKGQVVFQCLVNCEGKADDFQIIGCPTKLTFVGNQILEVLKRDYTEWEAGIQNKKNVDVLVRVVVNVEKGKMKIKRI